MITFIPSHFHAKEEMTKLLLLSSKSTIYFFLLISITFELIKGNEINHLLSFKALLKDPTHSLSNWNHSLSICNWNGITCSLNKKPHVIKINLSSKNLSGQLSCSLFLLPFVVSINLSRNQLHGNIPKNLGSSSNVRHLDLSGNGFSGVIPEELTICKKLETLDLSHNLLSGTIPSSLGQMPLLKKLDLSNNHLSGVLPSTIRAFLANNLSFVEGNDLCINDRLYPRSELPPCPRVKEFTTPWWGQLVSLFVVIFIILVVVGVLIVMEGRGKNFKSYKVYPARICTD